MNYQSFFVICFVITGMHVNKALYTCSYMAVAAGVAGLFTFLLPDRNTLSIPSITY